MKIFGTVTKEDCFIRGTEWKEGTTKDGHAYAFGVVRFDDEAGEGFELRLEAEAKIEDFPRRKEGKITINVYHGKGYGGKETTYLRAKNFEAYK